MKIQAFALILVLVVSRSAAAANVTIPVGADIQAAINANPAGTTFLLPAGERRLTTQLVPKTGNTFVGVTGTVLNGSKLLTSFTPSSGKWYVTGQKQQGS